MLFLMDLDVSLDELASNGDECEEEVEEDDEDDDDGDDVDRDETEDEEAGELLISEMAESLFEL